MSLFDLNGNGKVDPVETAVMLAMFDDDIERLERKELEEAGLDYDELAAMDEEERRETLENEGYDLDDFDF